MCDAKNDLHKIENCKSKDNATTRLELDISETTDTYPEYDFLDLRKLQIKEKKSKHKKNNEDSTNRSSLFSEEDSDVEALARLYEEKYATCNDYAELGEGYDEDDSFIDNSDAINDLVPSGIRTELGGFYINRGKLNFVKEDNSSSSNSEDVDKFLAHNRLNSRKLIISDDEDEKESSKAQSNNQNSTSAPNSGNVHNNHSSNNINNHFRNNNNGSLHSNIIKSRKRSGEYQHKSKKIRKTATPKIPEHLLQQKPFPGSLEYRKNINEFKKNKLKSVESDKKSTGSNLVVNSSCNNNEEDNNTNTKNSNSVSTVNNSNNNSEDDKEVIKKKPSTVKEIIKERDSTTGSDAGDKQSSSSSDSSESSSSDSESESSEDTSNEKEKSQENEKEKTRRKSVEEIPQKNTTLNGSISKEITAKSFAHLGDNFKDLIAEVVGISSEEKNKTFNSKLNSLLISMDQKLRELPLNEKNSILEYVAEILQMKKENITKKTKKLLVAQEENKMSQVMRKLKDAVSIKMPLLESNFFSEFTKASGTSPQIYAELSRYYWSIDSSAIPQRKFPWNDELRQYLREIVQFRKNCYNILKPRKESLTDYIKNFLETKVKRFWPEKWMTVEILMEEAQVPMSKQIEDNPKAMTKILGSQNSSTASHKKSVSVPTTTPSSKKLTASGSSVSTSSLAPSNRKSNQGGNKNPEVKSILIPRKTPQSSSLLPSSSVSSKTSFPSSASATQQLLSGSRLQVTLNRLNIQDFSQTIVLKNSNKSISPNRSQQSVSPNRSIKTSSPNSVLNPTTVRPTVSKSSSPNSANKLLPPVRNSNTPQTLLKTIEIHSNPVPSMKSSPNSVTISPVNESVFKDMTPSPEVLNLTKNSSVYISKVNKESGESKLGRSNSPSINIPLPSGITICPTNASPSNFLSKQQKPSERPSDVKINVSITKQESSLNLTKEKRESVLNMNVKREGPLQNIPDCISVTPKVVQNDRPKYEHVRKRALHEYHLQQSSPEKMKTEEKKMRTDDNLLTDIEIKDDKLDDKNFSKIFESVIAKTTETVRQSENVNSQIKSERFSSEPGGSASSGIPMGVSQNKNNSTKLKNIRCQKYESSEDKMESMKEQQVQMEMDRVMQNLVELSRGKKPEYDFESQHMAYPSSTSSGLKPHRYPDSFQKVLYK